MVIALRGQDVQVCWGFQSAMVMMIVVGGYAVMVYASMIGEEHRANHRS